VVPVIITCAEPDITLSLLSLFLIVVSIDEVNEFKLLVDVCNVPITVLLLPVYVFNNAIEPVTPSIEDNLPSALDVKLFNELVEVSIEFSLPFALDVKELNVVLTTTGSLFKVNEPVIPTEPVIW
jgi:hypothetical protein